MNGAVGIKCEDFHWNAVLARTEWFKVEIIVKYT